MAIYYDTVPEIIKILLDLLKISIVSSIVIDYFTPPLQEKLEI